MRLKPLQQWVCDTCGEIIEKPEDGYVQFGPFGPMTGYTDFIIVHHLSASPRKNICRDGCYKYHSDIDLSHYLGTNGISSLLALVDPGVLMRPVLPTASTSDFRKWVELFRRLQTPYYEEARLYFDRAYNDGFFDGANEIWPYLPDTLRYIVEHYADNR